MVIVDREHKDKYNRNRVLARKIRRKKLLAHYGGLCDCCGEWRYELLSIDHKNGGGNKHRNDIGASNILYEIEKNGFPDDYRILCHNCNMAIAFYGYCPHQITNDKNFDMSLIT
jgi:hypothetical protein